VERKAIREHVPWTRLVAQARPPTENRPSTLMEFITGNRERLALKPNDDSSDQHSYFGWEMDGAEWDRALKQAGRSPVRGAGAVDPVRSVFPLLTYGHLEFREMQVDVHPHAYLGKVQGCSSGFPRPSPASPPPPALCRPYIVETK